MNEWGNIQVKIDWCNNFIGVSMCVWVIITITNQYHHLSWGVCAVMGIVGSLEIWLSLAAHTQPKIRILGLFEWWLSPGVWLVGPAYKSHILPLCSVNTPCVPFAILFSFSTYVFGIFAIFFLYLSFEMLYQDGNLCSHSW